MRLQIICFTKNGCELAGRIKKSLPDYEIMINIKSEAFKEHKDYLDISLKELTKNCFTNNIPMVFIGAMGIAVRTISEFVTDKLSDIPVIVCDELGNFTIPVLSGHVGGANELACLISKVVGSYPVITTATDINEKPAIDVFAEQNRLKILNKEKIAKVSSKVLRNEHITVNVNGMGHCDVKLLSPQDDIKDTEDGPLLIKPREYILGIGCKKNTDTDAIEKAVFYGIETVKAQIDDIAYVATIDIKKDEQGLVGFCDKYRIPMVCFSAEELKKVKGNFSESEFVEKTVGVGNVCERAALLLSGESEAVLKKTSFSGVTVSIAKRKGRVYFE